MLNLTLRQILKRLFSKSGEPPPFSLPELSPWKGRRAKVYDILDDCWARNIRSYKDLKKEVKTRTGVSCSSALIAAWKSKMANDSDYPNDPPPPSPKTGKEKPDRPYG
jgi:hypothetical protein